MYRNGFWACRMKKEKKRNILHSLIGVPSFIPYAFGPLSRRAQHPTTEKTYEYAGASTREALPHADEPAVSRPARPGVTQEQTGTTDAEGMGGLRRAALIVRERSHAPHECPHAHAAHLPHAASCGGAQASPTNVPRAASYRSTSDTAEAPISSRPDGPFCATPSSSRRTGAHSASRGEAAFTAPKVGGGTVPHADHKESAHAVACAGAAGIVLATALAARRH
jgi:hypothetical protein